MPTKYTNAKGTLNIPLIQQPMAFIEDTQYPQTGNRLPDEKIYVRFRDKGFARHQFQGMNVTLLELFRQFMSPYKSNGTNILANVVLGVRQNDYMSGLDDLSTAIDGFVQQAQNSTAEVSVSPVTIVGQKLVADVKVTNKTGHRFPSGVGFRRAFLELRVVDNDTDKTVWCSGCTNELGVIVNGSERLPSELFDVYKDGTKPATLGYPAACNRVVPQHYQPHFFTGSPITRQDQVQIYEELNLNIPADYLHETFPVSVGGDPAYADGSGTNIVRYEIPLTAFTSRNVTVTATLYYQSIPPYFLNDRFSQAPTGPATQRLHYLTSNLQTKGTAIENWKFQIATASEVATLR